MNTSFWGRELTASMEGIRARPDPDLNQGWVLHEYKFSRGHDLRCPQTNVFVQDLTPFFC